MPSRKILHVRGRRSKFRIRVAVRVRVAAAPKVSYKDKDKDSEGTANFDLLRDPLFWDPRMRVVIYSFEN